MSAGRYRIPAAAVRVEEEIKRSRFITSLAPASSVETARAFIAEVSAEFADANHNCWAYVAGPPGSTGQIGMSDDGEPHGTAGRPMLTVLLHSGVGDLVAVVTRYFGGVLLGTGGLVRAYSGGVQAALARLATVERALRAEMTLVFDYSAITSLQRLLPRYEAELLGQEFEAGVTFHLRLPQEQVQPFTAAVSELTNGRALVEVTQPLA